MRSGILHSPATVVIVARSVHGKKGQHIELLAVDSEVGSIVRVVEQVAFPPPRLEHFDVGEKWSLEFNVSSRTIPPRTETIVINRAQWVGEQEKLREFVQSRVNVWKGGLTCLFNGALKFTHNGPWSGTAFVSKNGIIPQVSLGFWMPDRDLSLSPNSDDPHYIFEGEHQNIRIPYRGDPGPVKELPAGSLLCVSLMPWWKPSGPIEERSHLYICGCYFN
jgi:hypothetical protein